MFINSISKKYNKEGPGKKDGYDLICPVCEKVFYKKKSIVENALSFLSLRAFFCSVECKNSKKGQFVYKKQLMQNYGVENNFQREEVKSKSKETCIEKYGKEFACQSNEVIEKIKQGNLKGHGYTSPQKNPEIKKKTLNTVKLKYKDLVGCMPREKTEETNLKKYGSKYFFSSVKGRMTNENLKNNFGWTDEELIERRRKQVSAPRRNGNKSSLNEKFKNFLLEKSIDFKEEFEIVKEDGRFYYYDFKVKNFIIEINGDYWHANPVKYNKDDIFYIRNSSVKASEIWQRDKEKNDLVINKGYGLIIFWEFDIKNNEKIFDEFLDKISSIQAVVA